MAPSPCFPMTPMPRLENGQVTGKVFVMDYVGNMAEGEGFELSYHIARVR